MCIRSVIFHYTTNSVFFNINAYQYITQIVYSYYYYLFPYAILRSENMKHSLEKHKAFPFIAWIIFIGFAVFVFYITISLQSTSETFAEHTQENLNAIENTK